MTYQIDKLDRCLFDRGWLKSGQQEVVCGSDIVLGQGWDTLFTGPFLRTNWQQLLSNISFGICWKLFSDIYWSKSQNQF